jgi:hypothetical protein
MRRVLLLVLPLAGTIVLAQPAPSRQAARPPGAAATKKAEMLSAVDPALLKAFATGSSARRAVDA